MPRKKATVLKLASGTFKTSQSVVNEATYKKVEDYTPPATINAQGPGARKWKELAPHLAEKGLFTEVDKQNLEAYCMAYEMMLKAQRDFENDGISVTGAMGLKMNPAVTVFNSATTVMARYSALLGLDPASRTKIEARPDGAKAKSFGDLVKPSEF